MEKSKIRPQLDWDQVQDIADSIESKLTIFDFDMKKFVLIKNFADGSCFLLNSAFKKGVGDWWIIFAESYERMIFHKQDVRIEEFDEIKDAYIKINDEYFEIGKESV